MKIRTKRCGAFSLIEGVIATMIVVVFLSGIFVLSGQTTALLRYNKETAAASQNLQERIELLRRSNWGNLTNSAYVAGVNVLLQPTTSGEVLPVLSESIRVDPFYTEDVVAPDSQPAGFQVTRRNNVVTVTNSNADIGAPALNTQRLVRVTVDLSWTAMGGRTRQMQTSTVIAQGGVLR